MINSLSIGLVIHLVASMTLRIRYIDGTDTMLTSGVVINPMDGQNLDTQLFASVEILTSIPLAYSGSIIKKTQYNRTYNTKYRPTNQRRGWMNEAALNLHCIDTTLRHCTNCICQFFLEFLHPVRINIEF